MTIRPLIFPSLIVAASCAAICALSFFLGGFLLADPEFDVEPPPAPSSSILSVDDHGGADRVDLEKLTTAHFERGASLGYEMAARGGTRDELLAVLFASRRTGNPQLLARWFKRRIPTLPTTLDGRDEAAIDAVTLGTGSTGTAATKF